MIVDLHTHVWDTPDQLGKAAAERMRRLATPWAPADASVTSHERAMQPVQKAVVLGLVCRHIGANISLEQVAKVVARQPGRLAGFAGIDPMADNYLDLFEQAMAVGLAGVLISPAAQDFHPTHTRAMRLYDRCAQQGIPVMVHPGYTLAPDTKLEFDDPVLFDEVARSFPDLKLIIAQVGHPWIDQTLVMLSKHSQVYADLTDVIRRPWQLYHVLFMAHQQGVIGNLLFGSDFPFCTPERAITTIYSINTLTQGTHLPSVPREQLRSVVERDSLTCLGIGTGLRGTGLEGLKAATADPQQDDQASSLDDEAIEQAGISSAQAGATSPQSREADSASAGAARSSRSAQTSSASSSSSSTGHSIFRRRNRQVPSAPSGNDADAQTHASDTASSSGSGSDADSDSGSDAESGSDSGSGSNADSGSSPASSARDNAPARQAHDEATHRDPAKNDANAPGDLPDHVLATLPIPSSTAGVDDGLPFRGDEPATCVKAGEGSAQDDPSDNDPAASRCAPASESAPDPDPRSTSAATSEHEPTSSAASASTSESASASPSVSPSASASEAESSASSRRQRAEASPS